MDVLKLAKQLEPYFPDQVRRWVRAYQTQPDLRSTVSQAIVSKAYAVFGDVTKKLILSLPPKERAAGPLHLGMILHGEERWPLGLKMGELLQHLAIFGRSGAGKTNATLYLLSQLARRGVPFLLLDWKRNGRDLIPHLKQPINVYTPGRPVAPLAFNPFIPPPRLERNVFITHVVDVLGDAFTLGDAARSVLQKALHHSSATPTPEEVIEKVRSVPDDERVRGWKISALRALESIAFSEITATTPVDQEDLVRSFLKQPTVVELDALGDAAKKFLTNVLCMWVYYAKLSTTKREQLSLVIVLEEAHNVLYRGEGRTKETVMNRLLRQCREIGIGVVLADQQPHLLSSAALANTYTSVCFNLKDPIDVNRVAAMSLLDEEDRRWLTQLPVGQAIVKLQDRWRQPMLIRVPHVALEKGTMTDARLRAYLAQPTKMLRPPAPIPREELEAKPLQDHGIALLYDIFEHPHDGVRERYARLGLAAGTGDRIKTQLVDRGLIREELLPIGSTRKLLLRLTQKGTAELGISGVDGTNASAVHEYWKEHFAERLRSSGFVVAKEVERIGSVGRVDILAERVHERRLQQVAIEIETGKSSVVDNVLNNLRAGYDPIVVIATSPAAHARVATQLAGAGLQGLRQVAIAEAKTASAGFQDLLREIAGDRRGKANHSRTAPPSFTPVGYRSYADRNPLQDPSEQPGHRGPSP